MDDQKTETDTPEVNDTSVETPAAEENIANSDTQQPALEAVAVTQDRKSRKKRIMLLIIGLILVLGAAGVYWYFQVRTEPPAASSTPPAAKTEEKKPEVTQSEEDAQIQKFINPTTGETWLAIPKKIASQKFYVVETDIPIEYYEVGARAGKTIYMTVLSEMGDDIRIYEKGSDGKVVLIALPDASNILNEENERYLKESLVPSISIDKTIHYDSLTLPSKITIDKNNVVTKPSPSYLGNFVRPGDPNSTTKYIDVKSLGKSKLQRVETSYTDTKLTAIGYRMITPINTEASISYEPLEKELSKYQWQRGSNYLTDTISAISRGCGGRLTAVTRADTITDADVQLVGRSGSGLDVYDLKDTNSALLNKAYDEFFEYAKDSPGTPFAGISKADFIKEHGLVLYKDKNGQWLVYTRDQLRPGYGCAKPVVYLYPTAVTPVTVKVGADVKISEPNYNPATGWRVIATPSGKLLTGLKVYESLFWEGPGIGRYPGVSEGTVVPTTQAIATIKQQLTKQGLSQKEIADFVTYWEPKMPTKPYVRLTWFNTAQMDELAPLYITPKPDTVIRVFLDYSGLDTPVTMIPQNLTSIPRNGFTVVEWGGLSPQKLY